MDFHVEHPDVKGARRMRRALGLEVAVARAERAAVVAVIKDRYGRVERRQRPFAVAAPRRLVQ